MFTKSKLIEGAARCYKAGGTPKPPKPPLPPSPTQAAENSALAMRQSRKRNAINYSSALMGTGQTLGNPAQQTAGMLSALLGK